MDTTLRIDPSYLSSYQGKPIRLVAQVQQQNGANLIVQSPSYVMNDMTTGIIAKLPPNLSDFEIGKWYEFVGTGLDNGDVGIKVGDAVLIGGELDVELIKGLNKCSAQLPELFGQ